MGQRILILPGFMHEDFRPYQAVFQKAWEIMNPGVQKPMPWRLYFWNFNDPLILKGLGVTQVDQVLNGLIKVFESGWDLVLAYSMGGRLALWSLWIMNQKGLPWVQAHTWVFLSVHPGLEDASQRQMRQRQDATWAWRLKNWDFYQFFRAWDQQEVLSQSHLPERSSFFYHQNRRWWVKLLAHLSLARQPDVRCLLPSIPGEKFWWVGHKDSKFLKIAQSVPGVQVITSERAGHRILWDDPDLVARWLAIRLRSAFIRS